MLTKTMLLLGILIACVGCTRSSEARSENDVADCNVVEVTQELLSSGTDNKSVWENSLKTVEAREDAKLFLQNWRKGELYELTDAKCFESPNSVSVVGIVLSVPRLGRTDFTAQIEQGLVKVYFISLVDLYETL